MVVQHRHQLRLLLPRGALEEPRLVVAAVVDVRARQREILEDEHAGLIRLAVELRRQNVGHDAKRVEVGRLCGRDVGGEKLRAELVQPVRRCIARAAQEHWPSIDGKAPPPRSDVPGQLTKRKPVVDARRLGPVGRARDDLGAIHVPLAEAPRLPPLGAGERQPHGHRLLHPAAESDFSAELERLAARNRDHELDLTVHLPAVQVAQARLYLEPSVTRLEARLKSEPVHRDRADVLELDRLPQPERDLGSVWLWQTRVRGGRVRLEVAVVEQAHDVALLLRLRLDR